jgi:glutaredoxin
MQATLYTSPTCTHCGTVRDILDRNGIDYEERDVAASVDVMQELVNKTHQTSVPVLDVGGMTVVGADRRAIESLLETKGLLAVSQP